MRMMFDVRNGTVQEFALWNPTDLYYLTYYAAIALVNGEITGAPGDTVPRCQPWTIR
jgi:rhamnose transport system substrate-binding protein